MDEIKTPVPGKPGVYVTRNPDTTAKHKQEVFWQITVPLLVGVIIILAMMIFVAWSTFAPTGQPNLERWANVSTIWILLPLFPTALIILALLGGLTYLVILIIKVLPKYAFKLQNIMVLIQEKVKQFSDLAARPVIKVNEIVAGIKMILR